MESCFFTGDKSFRIETVEITISPSLKHLPPISVCCLIKDKSVNQQSLNFEAKTEIHEQ